MELYESSIIVSYPIIAAASWVGMGGGGGVSFLKELKEKKLSEPVFPRPPGTIQNSQKWREIPGVHNLQFSFGDDDCSLY